jgi:hypothetical protein
MAHHDVFGRRRKSLSIALTFVDQFVDWGMPKTTHRLTAITAQNLKKPGLHADGAGLYLKVQEGGSKSWVFRYMRAGKARYLGLGSASSVSLANARSLAAEARQQLQQDRDPIEARRHQKNEARVASARAMTFRDCAEAYMASHEPSWKNAKHREQWLEPNAFRSFVRRSRSRIRGRAA